MVDPELRVAESVGQQIERMEAKHNPRHSGSAMERKANPGAGVFPTKPAVEFANEFFGCARWDD